MVFLCVIVKQTTFMMIVCVICGVCDGGRRCAFPPYGLFFDL